MFASTSFYTQCVHFVKPMSKATGLCPAAALQMIWIGVLLITMSSFIPVSAQPTVDDDDAYCQSSATWEEFVNEIKADVKTSCQSGPHTVVIIGFSCVSLL